MNTLAERLDWLRYARPEEIDAAHAAGELDEVLNRRGLGRVTGEQGELVLLIEGHFPNIGLNERICDWTEVENGKLALMVDQAVLFTSLGDDLVMTGEIAPGQVGCVRITPDRKRRLAAFTPDPTSIDAQIAAQAANN